MLDLTRLNGHRLLVNADLIKLAEPSPDTTLTLITGEKLIVRESCDDLLARIALYKANLLASAFPQVDSAALTLPACRVQSVRAAQAQAGAQDALTAAAEAEARAE